MAAVEPSIRCVNPFTGNVETFYMENFRRGWKATGEFLGTPVFRIFNPMNTSEFIVCRPYCLKHRVTGEYHPQQAQRVMVVSDGLLNSEKVDLGLPYQDYKLEPVYTAAIQDGGIMEY